VGTAAGVASAADFKEREEQEYRADDARTCATVFRRLGFVPVLTYKKERTTWHWQGLSITLDRLAFGTFVELELERSVAPEDGRRVLDSCIRRLGLTGAPRVDASYADLQEAWNRAHPGDV
jgi:adenylate cyclase class IV